MITQGAQSFIAMPNPQDAINHYLCVDGITLYQDSGAQFLFNMNDFEPEFTSPEAFDCAKQILTTDFD